MSDFDILARTRKTLKLLGDPARPEPPVGLDRATVDALVEAAGWAPFHRPAHRAREESDPVCEPWRFAMLDAASCRAMLPRLSEIPKPPGKIANMLAVADALILVTWLPEPSGDGWEATDFNMEHIAAASAAVQNLLLAATERGIGSYWSSGGALGTQEAFEMLGIDPRDKLLGAIFLFPDGAPNAEAVPGKMREKRSDRKAWSRWTAPG